MRQRDRLVEYYANWSTLRGHDIPFQLEKLGVLHDCLTKEVQALRWDNTSVVVVGQAPRAEPVIEMFVHGLTSLGLKAVYHSFNHVSDQIEYGLEQIDGGKLSFGSSLAIVRFINRVAGVFRRDPVGVGLLRKHVITREVLVKVAGAPHGWVDEAEWLATSAALVPPSAI